MKPHARARVEAPAAFPGSRSSSSSLRRVFFAAPLLLLLAIPCSRLHAQQQAPVIGNLLNNPGAEAGSIAGWRAGGSGTPIADNGTFYTGINPHTGSYDFAGGALTGDTNSDSLSQTVSLTAVGFTSTQLDSGNFYADISFWEQGLASDNVPDDASVTITFFDANETQISSVDTGEIAHSGSWLNYNNAYQLPTGTRFITYTMNFYSHTDSSNIEAFIDDNELAISRLSAVTFTSTSFLPGIDYSLDFGTQLAGTTSPAQVVTVTNTGTVTVNISQIALNLGVSPAEFVQTNNCPAALAAGGTCNINIVFAPNGVGTKTAELQFNDDSHPPSRGIKVSGTGTGGILQVDPGSLKTIAGNGTAGESGDGNSAPLAELNDPGGIAFDPSGNLYIADTYNNVVRKVDTSGNISIFAGTGNGGFSGDGGPATAAELLIPFSVTSDSAGNIYIQDTGNSVVRKVDTTGKITTFAGTPGVAGHAGDGGAATGATLSENQGARFDSAGNLFVPQCDDAAIRKIDTAGTITTVAGSFTEGFSGDGGQATSAQLNCPSGVAIDPVGNFYIADEFNNRIRKVNTAGIISTIAGNGTPGSTGDNGPATAAKLNLPNDIAIDAAGNLYIADSGNNRIRKIGTNGIITTVAGGLENAGSAAVNSPLGVTTNSAGNVYFSDSGNNAVREIFPLGVAPFAATAYGSTAPANIYTLSNIGNLPLTIPSQSSFTLSDVADFALSGGTCLNGATLAAGGTCTLTVSFTPQGVGPFQTTVLVADTAVNSPQSFSISGTGNPIAPTIAWTAPASIVYGTPLSATQLNAAATGLAGAAVSGTFAYTPAAGTVLTAGAHTLNVVFTSTNPDYSTATASVPITVTQAPPTLTWATPASIAYGIPLSAAQLDAAVTGVGGIALPGTFTYTPAAGTVLTPGTHTLSVAFTPTDTIDYPAATGSVSIVITGLTLSAVAPGTVQLGSADTVITLTGSGFIAGSVVQVNGAAVVTTYVNPTTLTAVVPAADFAMAGTLQITVVDAAIMATSAAQTLTVLPLTPVVTLTGPSTTPPDSQPTVGLSITNPYPLDLTAVFTLSFASTATPEVDDPAIQFAGGGRTLTIVIPANTTVVPPVQLQAGTDAGTITIALALTAAGVNVTPTTLAPVMIAVPGVVPVITGVTLTRGTDQLTVVVHGYSNTREMVSTEFEFTGEPGVTLSTPSLTVPGTTLFGNWFSSAPSDAYGSTFTYTQIFNLSDVSSNVASVKVTFTNTVGTSTSMTAQ